ncbi:fluoride efflux transporter CrcB [Fictibacillus sp. KU28468]|uniref:fluoride efflux transporter CrcB n=1 Tax=Fictibacillus sp. KU28468 TaxID=2991053 RepID=UPI00223DC2D2|nr:fluoride efflux transporter CrcB [Fictibacillus sp. KU28468]UZJ77499.1 fluoride efflux transporter CrcB [Fictibacillus sp. KU28468]
MLLYVLVGLAGIAGSLLRYGLGLGIALVWEGSYPLATFLTNMAGSFALGYLTFRIGRNPRVHPYFMTVLGTGLIGSFTTFSTFTVENIQLLQTGRTATAFLYIILSLIGGLVMSWLGFLLGSLTRGKEEQRI